MKDLMCKNMVVWLDPLLFKYTRGLWIPLYCMSWRQLNFFSQTQKTISLKITTVDMKRPPPDFRSNFEAAQPPILIDNGIAILENEKIERHIMKAIPGGHNLFVADVEVAKKIENLYNKFKVR